MNPGMTTRLRMRSTGVRMLCSSPKLGTSAVSSVSSRVSLTGPSRSRRACLLHLLLVSVSVTLLLAQRLPAQSEPDPVRDLRGVDEWTRNIYSGQVKTVSGRVDYLPESRAWIRAEKDQSLHPGDLLLTARPGRAAVSLVAQGSSLANLELKEDSLLRLLREPTTNRTDEMLRSAGERVPLTRRPLFAATKTQPPAVRPVARLQLDKGQLYYREVGPTNLFEIGTEYASANPKGTEFLVLVDHPRRQTTVVMFDGEAELVTEGFRANVPPRHFGVASPGQPIRIRPLIQATNLVQWWIHYPAFVDPADLGLSRESTVALADSLAAYRRGNLRAAWERHPQVPDPPLPDDAPRALYLAALLLGSGQIEAADRCLDRPDARTHPVAVALRRLGRVLAHPMLPLPPAVEPRAPGIRTGTEWLAESYVLQSTHQLPEALAAARHAVEKSPESGGAWARVAELELGLGNLRRAGQALELALDLSPENAQARTLQGFLILARNRSRDALDVFNAALDLDSELPNAWLGRGLARIRRGDRRGGLEDLAMARLLDPGRSLVHGYAGKALADAGLTADAGEAFHQAALLDPLDPTPSLYAALLDQQENRVFSGVTNLEHSLALNDNRAVYRSQLLLDQDRAIRGANLASLYREAGLTEFAIRQASRAVEDDYSSFSAHQFLADSYNALRDPGQVSLRYESAWFSEYLTANLLAPVGASRLSTALSPNEYSRFFQREGPGFISRTDYTSNGDWRQAASQFGNFGTFAYAIDAYYLSDVGQRVNADAEQLTVSTQAKQQVGPDDSVFLQAIYYQADFGDLRPVYDPHDLDAIREDLRIHEHQEPLLFLGWNHHWQEGSDTLFLLARLHDRYHLTDPEYAQLVVYRHEDGSLDPNTPYAPTSLTYDSELVAWSLEGQQIWRSDRHTVVAGLRGQTGTLSTASELERVNNFDIPTLAQQFDTQLGRFSAYAYEHWQIVDWLRLSGGLAYDRLRQPVNYRVPPIAPGEDDRDLVSPKAGMTISPWEGGVFRAAYAQALGGVSLEQSVRLEPTQIAGLNQTWRSLIPEAMEGSVAGQAFELWGVGFEQRLPTRTYLTVRAESRCSEADRHLGSREYRWATGTYAPALVPEALDYRESALGASAHQFLGDWFSVGAEYRLSDVSLHRSRPSLQSHGADEATLQQLVLSGRFAHPTGFFAGVSGVWTRQSNRGDSARLAGDDFWHLNLDAGWRSRRRNFEIATGLLNLTDQDYRLNPLNLYAEPYRSVTWTLAVRFEL